jgi:hypothetical protein
MSRERGASIKYQSQRGAGREIRCPQIKAGMSFSFMGIMPRPHYRGFKWWTAAERRHVLDATALPADAAAGASYAGRGVGSLHSERLAQDL